MCSSYVDRSDPVVDAGVMAAIVDGHGGMPRVGSFTLPPRTTGTTLLEVVAAPLNPLDLLIASGTFHSVRHDAAYVPGSECVGIVLQSDIHAPGTQVYAECHPSPATPGAFANRVVVPDDDIMVLPDGVDPVRAAAIGNAGVAAYLPLIDKAALRAGESVLVLGATGAVGQLAVQVARLQGASHVTGVGRDRVVLERLLSCGADAVVALQDGENAAELAIRLAEATGPVDVIFDALYATPVEAALQVCAPGARVVMVGQSAGPTAQFPSGVLRGKQLVLSGFAGSNTPLRDKKNALLWLWTALASSEIQIDVRTVSLAELPEAWRMQASSPHAKFVVVPGNA